MIEDRLESLMLLLEDTVSTVPGIVLSTSTPPEQLAPTQFPATLIFPGVGSVRLESPEGGNGFPTRMTNVTIVVDIHVSRRDSAIGDAMKIGRRLLHPVLNKLFKMHTDRVFAQMGFFFGDPKNPGGYPITFAYSNLGWGTVETLGYRIKMDLSLEEDIA